MKAHNIKSLCLISLGKTRMPSSIPKSFKPCPGLQDTEKRFPYSCNLLYMLADETDGEAWKVLEDMHALRYS